MGDCSTSNFVELNRSTIFEISVQKGMAKPELQRKHEANSRRPARTYRFFVMPSPLSLTLNGGFLFRKRVFSVMWMPLAAQT